MEPKAKAKEIVSAEAGERSMSPYTRLQSLVLQAIACANTPPEHLRSWVIAEIRSKYPELTQACVERAYDEVAPRQGSGV